MSGTTIEAMPRDALGRVAPTRRQRRLLVLIDRMTRTNGYPPTIRELVAACKAKSPNAVAQQLGSLKRKGWVKWERYHARTLRLATPIGGLA